MPIIIGSMGDSQGDDHRAGDVAGASSGDAAGRQVDSYARLYGQSMVIAQQAFQSNFQSCLASVRASWIEDTREAVKAGVRDGVHAALSPLADLIERVPELESLRDELNTLRPLRAEVELLRGRVANLEGEAVPHESPQLATPSRCRGKACPECMTRHHNSYPFPRPSGRCRDNPRRKPISGGCDYIFHYAHTDGEGHEEPAGAR